MWGYPISNSTQKKEHSTRDEMEQIITDGNSYADRLVPSALDVPFLEVTSDSVLTEARRLGMISESTHTNIVSLQKEETEHFKSKSEVKADYKTKHRVNSVSTSPSEPLSPGQILLHEPVFFITWKLSEASNEALEGQSRHGCKACIVGRDTVVQLRNMSEQDCLYLSESSKLPTSGNPQEPRNSLDRKVGQRKGETDTCLDYARISAQRALQSLKSIPAAARRGLPVLVNSQGLLASIPSIDYQGCSCLMVSAIFKPKVPPRGDHSSFV